LPDDHIRDSGLFLNTSFGFGICTLLCVTYSKYKSAIYYTQVAAQDFALWGCNTCFVYLHALVVTNFKAYSAVFKDL